MNFSPPTKHQKLFLLGAGAVLVIASAGLVRNGSMRQNDLYDNFGGVPLQVAPANDSGTPSKNSPFLPPVSTATAVKTSAANNSANGVKSLAGAATGASAAGSASTAPLAGGVSAQSYLVANLATGQVYLSKDPTLENGLASISKLFTAIVAVQNMQPSDVIQITPAMLAVYPNSYGMMLGEKMNLSDLLYGMLLQSNDNIAEGIAMAYSSPSTYITAPASTTPSESAFIAKMNALAQSIGLTHTNFVDASGLDPGNVTDANDMFSFAQYLYKNQPGILAITTTYSYAVATSTDHFGHDFINIDPFVGDPHYIGGKTGRTDQAGEDMLSMFNYEWQGKDYPIAVIVLHSDLSERQNDSSQLYLQAITMIDQQR